jgi:radical SAM-linked protein
MTLDPSPMTSLSASTDTNVRRAKYRLRFKKSGDLRLVSHHDLMHCFERMLRRAALPLCTTQGFHPQPRMVFAQSLALGVVGSQEVVELEMSEVFSPEEVQARLVRQAPPGLEILQTRAIDVKASGQVRRAFYRLFIPPAFAANLAQRCAEFLAGEEAWVERTRPRPRRFNLRLYVHQLRFDPPNLEMALWVTANGSARPEEVARLLGLEPLLQEGAFFDRYHLELHDEVSPEDREGLPPGLLQPASSLPVTHTAGDKGPPEEPTSARPTNLIPGPMSFDT